MLVLAFCGSKNQFLLLDQFRYPFLDPDELSVPRSVALVPLAMAKHPHLLLHPNALLLEPGNFFVNYNEPTHTPLHASRVRGKEQSGIYTARHTAPDTARMHPDSIAKMVVGYLGFGLVYGLAHASTIISSKAVYRDSGVRERLLVDKLILMGGTIIIATYGWPLWIRNDLVRIECIARCKPVADYLRDDDLF